MLDRRSFLKRLALVPAVPAAMLLGSRSGAVEDGQGNLIIKGGAKDIDVHGLHAKGGNIIIEPGAERVRLTNSLLDSRTG